MTVLSKLLALGDRLSPPVPAYAHCDLPCGVYDPAQARIEAESVKGCMEKFNASDDNVFKTRAVEIKEERAELVKHHLWVLWTDYFKPDHLEKYPPTTCCRRSPRSRRSSGRPRSSPSVSDGARVILRHIG